jgi:cytochrome b
VSVRRTALSMSAGQRTDRGRRVWDLPVRVTHWLLVVVIAGSWTTAQLDPSYFRWHEYCGYTVLVLVVFRLLWGFWGTRHARFRAFLRGPATILAYGRKLFKNPRGAAGDAAIIGHNPLGGVSVLLLLVALLAQGATGLFSNDDIANAGPFYGWVSSSLSNTLTAYHHRIFIALEVLIGVHIAAILYYLWARRENLIVPMWTGRKPSHLVPPADEIGGSRLGLALLIVLVLATALAVAIHLAPEPSMSLF